MLKEGKRRTAEGKGQAVSVEPWSRDGAGMRRTERREGHLKGK